MKPSEIRAKYKELSAKQAEAMEANDLTLGNQLQGEMNAYNDMLDVSIASEQLRADNAEKIVKSLGKDKGDFLTQCFGGDLTRFKSEFADGFKAAMQFPATPTTTDTDLPVADRPFVGVLDTLAKSGTAGNVEFFRLTADSNAAAQWLQGDGVKPESSRAWTPFTANLVWVATNMPITRTAASDYAQVEGIIRNELMADLRIAKNREVMVGAKANGITGILNTAGIQTYAKVVGDNVYDSIRRMVTKARLTGRVIPQYAALSPVVAETMDLLKNDNGTYLRVNDGGRVWSLQIVEEEFLTVTSGETTNEGAMVYAGSAATFYTAENDSVSIGLVGNQFLENAFTLLAESRNALAVKRPKGFVYMAAAV